MLRLEQLRDRINLSKSVATALEKEVIMLEGQPTSPIPESLGSSTAHGNLS